MTNYELFKPGARSTASIYHRTSWVRRNRGRFGLRPARKGRATWEVRFAATGDLGGHIRRIDPAEPLDRPLTSTVEPQSGIMLRSP